MPAQTTGMSTASHDGAPRAVPAVSAVCHSAGIVRDRAVGSGSSRSAQISSTTQTLADRPLARTLWDSETVGTPLPPLESLPPAGRHVAVGPLNGAQQRCRAGEVDGRPQSNHPTSG